MPTGSPWGSRVPRVEGTGVVGSGNRSALTPGDYLAPIADDAPDRLQSLALDRDRVLIAPECLADSLALVLQLLRTCSSTKKLKCSVRLTLRPDMRSPQNLLSFIVGSMANIEIGADPLGAGGIAPNGRFGSISGYGFRSASLRPEKGP
jgi:hypothetical protein